MVTINNTGLLAQFEAHLASSALAPATVVNYLADLRAFLRWNEAARGVDGSPFSLDAPDIHSYCLYLQAKSHAAATVNRRLQTLRKFYDFALAQGWTAANPADDVPLLCDVVPQRSQCRSLADVQRVLAKLRNCGQDWPPRDQAIIQTMLGAGLKLGELIDLCAADVHLDEPGAGLRIRAGQNGSSAERWVPLSAEVREALLSYAPLRRPALGVDRFFVSQEGRALSTRSVQRLLHDCAQDAGLDGLTAQDLRYAFARTVFQKNGDVREVARLLGHRHLATTTRYLRPSSVDTE